MRKKRFVRKAIVSNRALPNSIRYPAFRMMLKVPSHPKDIIFQQATTREDLESAFRVLHESYVKQGYCKPHPSGLRTTIFHTLPSTIVLIAKKDDRVIATLSVIGDGHFGMPMDEIVDFSHYRKKEEKIAEVSSLAIDPNYRGSSGQILFSLFRYLLRFTLGYTPIERFVISYHPDHVALYEAILGFKRIYRKAIQEYDFANGAPAVCSTINVIKMPQLLKRYYRSRPKSKNLYEFTFGELTETALDNMQFPNQRLNSKMLPPLNLQDFLYLYEEKTGLISELTQDQADHLRKLYNIEAQPGWLSDQESEIKKRAI